MPLFAGDVISEEFYFNEVPVKNLKGVLVSNGSDINSLKGECEQTNTDGLTSARICMSKSSDTSCYTN